MDHSEAEKRINRAPSKHTPGTDAYDVERAKRDPKFASYLRDAKIRAAAPEMLAALRDILTVADRFDEHSPETEHARALLARLDGAK